MLRTCDPWQEAARMAVLHHMVAVYARPASVRDQALKAPVRSLKDEAEMAAMPTRSKRHTGTVKMRHPHWVSLTSHCLTRCASSTWMPLGLPALAQRTFGSHPAGKCRRRGTSGRAKPAKWLGRTAKTSRTTTPKRPAQPAVDTTVRSSRLSGEGEAQNGNSGRHRF